MTNARAWSTLVMATMALAACATAVTEPDDVGGTGGTGGASGAGGSGGTGGEQADAAGGASGAGGGGKAGAGGSSGTGGTAGGGGTTGSGGSGGTGGTGGACTPPVSGPCDTSPQCGCQSGEACDIAAIDGSTTCRSPGTNAPYTECAYLNDCPVGYSCAGGVCAAFCTTAADCPGSPYRQCEQLQSATTQQPIPGYLVCSQQCDPRNPQASNGTFSPCGPGLACAVATKGATDCYKPTGSAAEGGKCTTPLDCQAGLWCVKFSATDTSCAKWCQMGMADCTGGKICSTLNPAPKVGTFEFGICH